MTPREPFLASLFLKSYNSDFLGLNNGELLPLSDYSESSLVWGLSGGTSGLDPKIVHLFHHFLGAQVLEHVRMVPAGLQDVSFVRNSFNGASVGVDGGWKITHSRRERRKDVLRTVIFQIKEGVTNSAIYQSAAMLNESQSAGFNGWAALALLLLLSCHSVSPSLGHCVPANLLNSTCFSALHLVSPSLLEELLLMYVMVRTSKTHLPAVAGKTETGEDTITHAGTTGERHGTGIDSRAYFY